MRRSEGGQKKQREMKSSTWGDKIWVTKHDRRLT